MCTDLHSCGPLGALRHPGDFQNLLWTSHSSNMSFKFLVHLLPASTNIAPSCSYNAKQSPLIVFSKFPGDRLSLLTSSESNKDNPWKWGYFQELLDRSNENKLGCIFWGNSKPRWPLGCWLSQLPWFWDGRISRLLRTLWEQEGKSASCDATALTPLPWFSCLSQLNTPQRVTSLRSISGKVDFNHLYCVFIVFNGFSEVLTPTFQKCSPCGSLFISYMVWNIEFFTRTHQPYFECTMTTCG